MASCKVYGLVKTYPSGNMLIICLPIIRDELCKILAGRTLFSEMASSLSKKVFVRSRNHPWSGSFEKFSLIVTKPASRTTYANSEHQHEIKDGMQPKSYMRCPL